MTRKTTRSFSYGRLRALVGLLLVGVTSAACAGEQTGSSVEGNETASAETERAADGPQVTFNFAHPFGADHHLKVDVLEPWFEELAERSGETLNFEIHSGGSLADPAATFDLTADGAIDSGYSLAFYSAGRFPLSEVFELPFLFSSSEAATSVFWDIYDEFPELREEYDDVVVLGVYLHDPGELFTSATPIHSLDDVRGLRIRAPGAMQGELIRELGGSPVELPAGEIFDGLDRGVIDGYMNARSAISTLGLEEITGHAALAGFYAGPGFIVMNRQKYEMLSDAQKALIDEMRGRPLSMLAAQNFDEQSEANRDSYEDWGIEVNELSSDEISEWREHVAEIPERWMQRQEQEGRPVGRELYEGVLQEVTN